jgi:hypothetical protein
VKVPYTQELCLEVLASGKVVWGDSSTEVSQPAEVCTDEQEWNMRHGHPVSSHVIAKPQEHQKGSHADSSGLDRRTFILPWEISSSTSWQR